MTGWRLSGSALALVVGLLLIAGCGADPIPTTSNAAFPPVVVDAWLDALQGDDAAAAGQHVEPVGASFVLAIENGLSDEQLVELLETGWPPELTESFWRSFRDEFGAFVGVDVDEVTVMRHTPLDGAGGSFAVVRVDVDGTIGQVLTRRDADGTWRVDLLATLGGAFVPLVVDRVLQFGDGSAADYLRQQIVETVLPGLDAAVIVYPDDLRLETEVTRIRRSLGAS